MSNEMTVVHTGTQIQKEAAMNYMKVLSEHSHGQTTQEPTVKDLIHDR
jgi:hypothetical protein